MAQPNIIFILIDDLGWRDLGCYGSTFYETPNLDRLAAQGMHFTDAYAACPVCSPTRASLLTGKYPATVGITDWIDWNGKIHPARGKLIDVPYLKHLPLEENNLARVLRAAGYHTWHVGKWHLGGEGYHPNQQGFEVNQGGCHYGSPPAGYFSPFHIPTLKDGPKGEFLTDRLTDEAIRLIETNDGHPFFLNLWYYAVHIPIQAKVEVIQYFEEKARQMGLDQVDPFVVGELFPCEHKKDQHVIRRQFQSDPVYAALVKILDENIGRLLETLERCQLSENTLVIFTSDNGGLATSEGSPTCNTPLAEGKGWMYEGGVREPLIIRWPDAIQAGSRCIAPITSPDFFPTILEAVGLELHPKQHVDGVSFLPYLRGGLPVSREAIFWHYPHYGNQGGKPGASVRSGDHKLIEFFEDDSIELYNLQQDPGETYDLSKEDPKQADYLRGLLHAWQAQVKAQHPAPNPNYIPWR